MKQRTQFASISEDALASSLDRGAELGGADRLRQGNPYKIWVDLDNSPHVPFFCPIMEELTARGYELIITARDAYQVRELLKYYKVPARIVGKHTGNVTFLKALGTVSRALALSRHLRRLKPHLSISHGSRGCLLASSMLRIPNITLIDYEFVTMLPFIKPTSLMVPSVVPDDRLRNVGAKITKYPGIKEDVYLARFQPDGRLRGRLGLDSSAVVALVRPPATEAHYHNPQSDMLLAATLATLLSDPRVRIILSPRNGRQEQELRSAWTSAIACGAIVIPRHVEDGLNLIWNSDLVISGGGTMNREAAALGVPVYSIFCGKLGAVDDHLSKQGRLILLRNVEDIRTRIRLQPREPVVLDPNRPAARALEAIIENIESTLKAEMSRRVAKR